MKYLLTLSIFDTLVLFIALIISFVFGSQFQPNLISFIVVYLGTRTYFYHLWFKRSGKTPPWIRISIHTVILLIVLPTVVALSGYLLSGLSNNVFWFGIIPFVSVLTSLAIHNIYKLS